jgi:hypothetical protein
VETFSKNKQICITSKLVQRNINNSSFITINLYYKIILLENINIINNRNKRKESIKAKPKFRPIAQRRVSELHPSSAFVRDSWGMTEIKLVFFNLLFLSCMVNVSQSFYYHYTAPSKTFKQFLITYIFLFSKNATLKIISKLWIK